MLRIHASRTNTIRVEDPDARILILGAGPAGLAAAWFLRKQGFRNVTVFERQGRVGGLCRSITDHGRAVEVGAAFVSPDFHEVLALAHELGAELEKVRGIGGFTSDPTTGSAHACSLVDYIIRGRSARRRVAFALASVIYLWKRRQLNAAFESMPTGELLTASQLNLSLGEWLRSQRLAPLTRAFEGPVSAFGYGSLDEIPAYYGLRYMTGRAFIAGLLSLFPGSRHLPSSLVLRHFRLGFQRLWEQMAWQLDVRLNVELRALERSDAGIDVEWSHPEHLFEADTQRRTNTSHFDYLIVACPPDDRLLRSVGRFDADEHAALDTPIQTIRFAIIGLQTEGLRLPRPLLLQVPPPCDGQPMLISKQNPQGTFVSCYGRLPGIRSEQQELEQFRQNASRCITDLGGTISPSDGLHFSDIIHYFHHYRNEELRRPIWWNWEGIQGHNATFFTGGLFDFDHVEGAVRASRRLVELHFPGQHD